MGHLAPVAYFQMDNCWQENKNQFVLAFMCMLVEMGVFQKVSFKISSTANVTEYFGYKLIYVVF